VGFDRIRRVEKRLVAAINGPDGGSGVEVALLCDIQIDRAGVRAEIPEIDLGVPSGITVWPLPRGRWHPARSTCS